MSKMGVSTVASYTGAQIFEAVGLGPDVIESCFTGTSSRLGGVEFDVLAEEVLAHHRRAFPPDGVRANHRSLITGGEYQWRREGEIHLFNPQTVFRLQHSTRAGPLRHLQAVHRRPSTSRRTGWRRCAGCSPSSRACARRCRSRRSSRSSEIVKRFGTGAISYGSI